MSDTSSSAKKLPVWRTAKAAYQVIFYNPGLAIKLGIIPLVLVFIPGLLYGYIIHGVSVEQQASTLFQNPGLIIALYAVVLLSYFTTIPMITAWHRMVILGHTDPSARINYSIGRTEWSYLWRAFLFGLLLFAIYLVSGMSFLFPATVISSMTSSSSIVAIVMTVMLVALTLVMTGFALRISLVFPAAAVGKPISFRESWQQTHGNTWRLFAAVCLGFIPSWILPELINGVVFGYWMFDWDNVIMPSLTVQVVMLLISIPSWLIGFCVGVSIWSWAYRYLLQGLPISLPGE